jgi:hypothetical protein
MLIKAMEIPDNAYKLLREPWDRRQRILAYP